jgi:hypothetical protein
VIDRTEAESPARRSPLSRFLEYLRALAYLPVHTRDALERLVMADRQREKQIQQLREEVAALRTNLVGAGDGPVATMQHAIERLDRNYWAVQDTARLGETREQRTRETLARLETRLMLGGPMGESGPLAAHEFQAFSQFGEDGILQWLTRVTPLPDHRFVEFGVEDYRQANTRLLLLQDRWSGLIFDGNAESVARIRSDDAFRWRDLTAVHCFITAENINELLTEQGFCGDLGLLSIDIDGNDYWVWESLTAARAAIVVIEYNYRFGPTDRVCVPYDPSFVRTEAHPSGIYFGASLAALCDLGARKGYAFVGCASGGVNAFFVRRDLLPAEVPELTPEEGYVAGQHHEFRTESGDVVPMPLAAQRELLYGLPLVHFDPESAKQREVTS